MLSFPARMSVYAHKETEAIQAEEERTKKMLGAYTNIWLKKETSSNFELLTELVDKAEADPQVQTETAGAVASNDAPVENGEEEKIALPEATEDPDQKIAEVYVQVRELETNRLLPSGVKEGADDVVHKWSEIETLNLLRGVLKHGENEWMAIKEEFGFAPLRRLSFLASVWRSVKHSMQRDLEEMNSKR